MKQPVIGKTKGTMGGPNGPVTVDIPQAAPEAGTTQEPPIKIETEGDEGDAEIMEDDEETKCDEAPTPNLATMLNMLVGVAKGKSLVPVKEMLERIMPDDAEGAKVLTGEIMRLCQAMEQLRNRAMELASQRQ